MRSATQYVASGAETLVPDIATPELLRVAAARIPRRGGGILARKHRVEGIRVSRIAGWVHDWAATGVSGGHSITAAKSTDHDRLLAGGNSVERAFALDVAITGSQVGIVFDRSPAVVIARVFRVVEVRLPASPPIARCRIVALDPRVDLANFVRAQVIVDRDAL